MSDNPYVVRHQDVEMAAWVASRVASEARAVNDALIWSLTHKARMNEARYALACKRIEALLTGPHSPSDRAIHKALYVSDRDAEEWLAGEYIGDWRDPESTRKGR